MEAHFLDWKLEQWIENTTQKNLINTLTGRVWRELLTDWRWLTVEVRLLWLYLSR